MTTSRRLGAFGMCVEKVSVPPFAVVDKAARVQVFDSINDSEFLTMPV